MFEPVEGMDGVLTATRGKLRCIALRLKSGGFCLYSPVAGLEKGAAALGPITCLLAPNHYHNKGVAPYVARFPDARLMAPQASCARLHKVTGAAVLALEDAAPDLAGDMRLIAPEGLKTGEVWVRARDGLVVVDAFAGGAGDGTSPDMLKTFPRYGVSNREVYLTWVSAFMAREKPVILVPCHGGVVRNAALPGMLTTLATETI